MPHEQPSFDFEARPAPAVLGDVERLLAWLSSNPGFHTARQITENSGLTDRAIRECAEKNPHLVVSGPGSPGYCHIHHCPVEKVNHHTGKMISQAKKMIRRAIATRRAAHNLIH